jgi:enoyl-CoA hydratase/carnithine racemase
MEADKLSQDKVLLEKSGAVAELVLNRPDKLNAVDGDCLTLFRQHIAAVEADDEVRAVVVRGAGRVFCAGADLEFVGDRLVDPAAFAPFLEEWHRTYDLIAACRKPTVAAVHGLALAGGFELTLVCDFVVLEEDAKMGDQHANFGLFPGGGSSQRLPRLIGERRAKWLMLSGSWVSPAEALQFGMVNAVVPPGQAAAKAREMAGLLAHRSPLANRNIKQSVEVGMQMDLNTALAVERRIALDHMRSQDVKIGLEAFRRREQPVFVGR